MSIIYFLEPWFLNRFFKDPQQLITASLISLVISKLIVFPWQLIGLLRASDKDFLKIGNTNKTRMIQVLMVLAIGFNLSASIDMIQSATFKKKQKEITEEYQELRQQNSPQYTLSLRNNNTQLVIKGEFDIGGHIYEGRGLSKLFTRQSLDTYVYYECSSACTTAFSGGVKRYLGTSAKLGFHQYKQDLNAHKKAVGFHDAEAEQSRDLELFKSRNIANNFLDKIFKESSNSMWFPSHQELLEARVINDTIAVENL